MKVELGPVIVSRGYFNVGDPSRRTVVEIEIAAPVESAHAQGEFQCSFRMKSPTTDEIETVYGTDTLQALQLALGHLEAALLRLSSSSGLSLRWAGGDPGDLGIRIPKFWAEEQA
jgi:hypothetical protein